MDTSKWLGTIYFVSINLPYCFLDHQTLTTMFDKAVRLARF